MSEGENNFPDQHIRLQSYTGIFMINHVTRYRTLEWKFLFSFYEKLKKTENFSEVVFSVNKIINELYIYFLSRKKN